MKTLTVLLLSAVPLFGMAEAQGQEASRLVDPNGVPYSAANPLPVASSGGGTPTGTAGNPNPAVTSVQGVPGGTPAPVSATALPLPTGAATSANQPALNADGGAASHVTNFPPAPALTAPGTPASTGITATTQAAAAVHTTSPLVSIAAGGSTVVITAGKIITGCDLVASGSYVLAYTTPAAPTTATASSTTGLLLSSGQSYHCPSPTPSQGLSIYNPGTAAINVGADTY